MLDDPEAALYAIDKRTGQLVKAGPDDGMAIRAHMLEWVTGPRGRAPFVTSAWMRRMSETMGEPGHEPNVEAIGLVPAPFDTQTQGARNVWRHDR